MYVHLRHCRLHRARDVDVVVAVEVGVDAALQGDLGGAEVPRLLGASGDVVEREEVRGTAQVEAERTFGEPAELALERAHVGVVDVAVVDPRDRVTDRLSAEFIGECGDRPDFRSACGKQRHDLVLIHTVTEFHSSQDLPNFTRDLGLR